jgi:hypothetical protein
MRGWRGCNSKGYELSGPTQEDWANLRRWWFGSVHEIANIELQRRTWLAPPTPSPHWSYVEFRCSYPALEQLEFARNSGHLSKVEFDLLATLKKAISEHEPPRGDAYDHRAILADPAWQALVANAEKTRQKLLLIVGDPEERNYLFGSQPSS